MSYQILFALMHRELKQIFFNTPAKLIDCAIMLLCNTIIYGTFMPLLGMPGHLIIPTYIGNSILTLLFLNNTYAKRLVFDQKYTHYIEYQMTFPTHIHWIICSYILSCMIQNIIIMAPLLTIGLLLLRYHIQAYTISLFAACLIVFLSLLFHALFFLFLSFHYSFDWFLRNAWPRRISPLFILSAIYFVWKPVFAFSPTIACFMLLNPCTLMVEGLRGSLLGFDDFVPYWYCVIMLVGYCILLSYGLRYAIYKKLDPVCDKKWF